MGRATPGAVLLGVPSARPPYRPRDAEQTALYGVAREHLDAFLRSAGAGEERRGLPPFIEREFREFLPCGILAHGFVRLRCEGCPPEHLVPFSCEGRGFCPSCGGRRMTERAAHLLDAVLPWVSVRQWVLTVPYPLRHLLAWNHRLSRPVLGVCARAPPPPSPSAQRSPALDAAPAATREWPGR